MKLKVWREKRGLTQREVAKMIGASSPVVVARYEAGRTPAPYMVERINEVTEGKVKPNDWYSVG